jgi:F-type H+-transporting ATPase subunit b
MFGLAALSLLCWIVAPSSSWASGGATAAAQEHDAAQPPGGQPREDHGVAQAPGAAQPEEEGHAEAGHGASESIWSFIARLVNFAILAGTLVYLLRSPITKYLADRGVQIRHDLTEAAALRTRASADLAEIDRRLQALPGEIEALKARGAQEIADEEARIAHAAEAERARLLEQTRRELDLRLRIARRDLQREAADLAVGVASQRIRTQIRDEDQMRLLDRYVAEMHGRREPEPGSGARRS